MTPAEQAAIAPQPHRLEIEARKLIAWCEQPWLSEMDRARYLGWAEGFYRKANDRVVHSELFNEFESQLLGIPVLERAE